VRRAAGSSVLVDFAGALGFSLAPEAAARIERYLEVLEIWNRRLRLTGQRSRDQLVRHHVADALACVPLLPDLGAVLDIGSGAGFPGAVLACVRPDLTVNLLDSRQRPVSFLNDAIRRIELSRTRACLMRAEDAAHDASLSGCQSLVVSRAIRMDLFFPLALPLLATGGLAVSMQTPNVSRETVQGITAPLGMELVELRDYQLPDGDARRLVVCRLA
jgi:16S rRNA (guanine527-N7)-methyltransferase